MKTFKSVFSKKLSEYLQLRRGLGIKSETEEFFLKDFDSYLAAKGHVGPLSQDLALTFATQNSDWSANYQQARYRTVRQFSSFLATVDPAAPILDPKALPFSRVRKRAHIFSKEEMKTLLEKAISLSPTIRGKAIHAMIGLSASSGLRISEIVRLDNSDVNLEIGLLTVRNSKFGKSRIVPIHSSVVKVLIDFATARDESFAKLDSNSFFVNAGGRRFTRNNVQIIFSKLAHAAGLRKLKGRGPSFHCLRHTFAVNRLVEWFQTGTDVQTMLPVLATYMGHVHYTESSYYLQGTPELLDVATKRFHKLF